MSATAILERARSLGVTLRLHGDTIKAKGPPPAIQQILPALKQHKPELLRALSETRLDPAEASEHWLIIGLTGQIERWFSPAITRSELAQQYPNRSLVALPRGADPDEQPVTPAEMAELDRLVQLVADAYQSPQEEIQEMREAAARNPGSALTTFRAMAKELGLPAQESLGTSKAGVGAIPNPTEKR